MYECSMNHPVRLTRSAAQTLQVFKVTSMNLDLSADRGEQLGARIRAGETEHLMARSN